MNSQALGQVFAGILFKPVEFKADDLMIGNKMIELLCFMVKYQGEIVKVWNSD